MDQEPRDKDKLMLENNKGSGGGAIYTFTYRHGDTEIQKERDIRQGRDIEARQRHRGQTET